MSRTINITYRPEEARFRAEFVRNNKVVDFKYLTNEEHEALDLWYGLPCDPERLVKLNAEAVYEALMLEAQMPEDSHFPQMVDELMGIVRK